MTWRILLLMAVRNLRRNIRMTLLTCLTASIGLAVVLWLQAVIAGRGERMIEAITSTKTGHLELFRQGYLTDHSMQKTFKEVPSELMQQLGPQTVAARRVHIPSLISSGEDSAQIMLEGIEPDQESKITSIKDHVVEGHYPENDTACAPSGILIGKPLAKLLNAEMGAKLVLLTQAVDGTLGNQLFRVSGIYDTSSPNFDTAYAFAPINCVQSLGAVQGVHSVSFHLADPEKIKDDRYIASLRAKLPSDLQLATWQDASPLIAAMLSFGETTVYMICAVLFAVVAMSIVNIMLIIVTERTREFGIVLAMGLSPGQVRLMVMMESFIMALVAAIVGTTLGLIVVAYQHRYGFDLSVVMGDRSVDQFKINTLIYPVFHWAPYFKIVFFVILVIVTAGLFPAHRASKLDPIKAINHT